jgi:glutamine amidotransferase
MTTVAILDYGMGNLRSVSKAVEHVAANAKVQLTHDAEILRQADRVIFPGQGAIASCIQALDKYNLHAVLSECLAEKPFLGICLGLQALYDESEEGGGTACLGVLPGKVKKFPASMNDSESGQLLKVPHMGWNQVSQTRAHPLWQGIDQDERFYFVHSYYVESADQASVAGTTLYGLQFTAAAARNNIFAVQFHPEKSQHAGLKLLKNFVSWDGNI